MPGEFTAIDAPKPAHYADNEREFDLSMQPFRFIHAANLLLDHQLQQIDYADPHLCATAEDSTLAAFRQLVRTAVDEQADFLLLTGNCFDAADQSLLAEIALLRGLEELDEQGIDVYIVPGQTDPAACWSSLPQLPKNTTILSGERPLSITRDETVIATIHPSAENIHAAADAPFPIAFRQHEDFFPPIARQFEEELIDGPTTEYELVSNDVRPAPDTKSSTKQEFNENLVRYWVLNAGHARRTVYADKAVAHHPGGTQGISAAQSGQHGCTLVEVDSTGNVELTFVPTAAVRFETVEITVHPHTDRDELLTSLTSAVAAVHRHPTETAWLLSWQVRGYGHGRDLLADSDFQHDIDEHLRAHFHDREVYIRSLGMIAPDNVASILESAPQEELAAEYWTALTRPQPATISDAETDEDAQLVLTSISGGMWETQLRELEKTFSDGDLLDQAAALGREWFSEQTEESA